MWGIVKKALNSTVGANMKTLDEIIKAQIYNNYYNTARLLGKNAIENGVEVAYGDSETITEIVLPLSVTEIGHSAFHSYYDLSYIVMPPFLKKIGEYAFYNTAIQSINIPITVKTIEAYAFAETSLQQIVYEGTMDQWFEIDTKPDWHAGNNGFIIVCSDGTLYGEET